MEGTQVKWRVELRVLPEQNGSGQGNNWEGGGERNDSLLQHTPCLSVRTAATEARRSGAGRGRPQLLELITR